MCSSSPPLVVLMTTGTDASPWATERLESFSFSVSTCPGMTIVLSSRVADFHFGVLQAARQAQVHFALQEGRLDVVRDAILYLAQVDAASL